MERKSRQWAQILTEATVADPPEAEDRQAFAGWLARQRQAWTEQIDATGLAWFQKAKLPLGAFSTLLWIHVTPMEKPQAGQFGAYRLRCRAIGDSCLFHVRRGELVRQFPIQEAAEFEADPVVLGSMDLKRDQLMQFVALEEVCYDDEVVLPWCGTSNNSAASVCCGYRRNSSRSTRFSMSPVNSVVPPAPLIRTTQEWLFDSRHAWPASGCSTSNVTPSQCQRIPRLHGRLSLTPSSSICWPSNCPTSILSSTERAPPI